MPRAIIPNTSDKDLRVMETLLSAGHIEHKYAVRLQTVINRTKGIPTNTAARVLGIDLNSVSNYVKRYNEGGIESLLKDKTRKPGKAPVTLEVKNRLTEAACTEKPEGGDTLEQQGIKQAFRHQPYRGKHDTEGTEYQTAYSEKVSIQH
jgi:transposase